MDEDGLIGIRAEALQEVRQQGTGCGPAGPVGLQKIVDCHVRGSGGGLDGDDQGLPARQECPDGTAVRPPSRGWWLAMAISIFMASR